MPFVLDPNLEADSLFAHQVMIDGVGFNVRLLDEEQFFWVLIIPEIPDITEFHDLKASVMVAMMRLGADLGGHLHAETGAAKINIANIGNMVAQFHLHVIARHRDDAVWPAPVWGNFTPIAMSDQTRQERMAILQAFLC